MAKTEEQRLIEQMNQTVNNQWKAMLKNDEQGFKYFAKEHLYLTKKLELLKLEKELTENLNNYLGEKKKPTAMGS
ncbi:hypothetical protein COE56_25940 [Bacillus anthracis]|nr:hypothetical protein COE56_25940 [Bacillus anthracis]